MKTSQASFRIAALLGALCLAGFSGCGNRSETSQVAAEEAKNVSTLTKDTFHKEVLEASQPVLVDFWATWCGPCRIISPRVAELATELKGQVKFGKVDVDAEASLAKQYDISAIPSLLIFKDGKLAEQFVGVRTKDELKQALEKYIAAAPKPSTSTN